jgi:hypothetical protein
MTDIEGLLYLTEEGTLRIVCERKILVLLCNFLLNISHC